MHPFYDLKIPELYEYVRLHLMNLKFNETLATISLSLQHHRGGMSSPQGICKGPKYYFPNERLKKCTLPSYKQIKTCIVEQVKVIMDST